MLRPSTLTQTSLQDYQDCPRRFQLRYVLEQPWPAVPSEPFLEHEQFALLGRRFHRLIEQHLAGLPAAALAASINAPELARWWRNYQELPPQALSWPTRYTELSLALSLGEQRLAARYDLVALEPGGRVAIIDWKTERQPALRPHLLERMQTRVYRYVLVAAGPCTGRPLQPEQVELIYWFAEFPAEPQHLAYDAAQYAADAAFLTSLIAEITGRTEAIFPLTSNRKHCRFCVYRSLCARESGAAVAEPGQVDSEPDWLDWDEIPEIAF